MEPTAQPRGLSHYPAFISYSHADERVAAWLHRWVETYAVPRNLVAKPSPLGPIPRRIRPIFRDRDELASSSDLSASIQQALALSEFLIVVCSPRAAQSHWVNEEIRAFQSMGKGDRILALLVDGDPAECFPPCLKGTEPIAADLRPSGDGTLNAPLKLIAGMLGVGFDALKQRDAARRRRRILVAASVSALMLTLGSFLFVRAETARRDLLASSEGVYLLANKLSGEGNLIGALERVEEVLAIRANDPRDHALQADLLQTAMQFEKAARAYETALELDPGRERDQKNLELCRELQRETDSEGRLARSALMKLHYAFYEQRRTSHILSMLQAAGWAQAEVVGAWSEEIVRRGFNPPPGDWLALEENGRLRLSLTGKGVRDLPDLREIPLAGLYISNTGVESLDAVKGLKLERLSMTSCPVRDLEPLRGMPMEYLAMQGSSVQDLSPLAGMPLKALKVYSTPISNIAALAGSDLDSLDLTSCEFVTDVSPVLQMTNLLHLTLPPNATNVAILRGHPSLSKLSFSRQSISKPPVQTTEEFWLEFDANPNGYRTIGYAKPRPTTQYELSFVGQRNVDLSAVPRDIRSLNLADTKILDLEALRGLPLVMLSLGGNSGVKDLSPLAGMPLEQLVLSDTSVYDLAPLAGLPLVKLSLVGTHVKDLSPLRGLPLKDLNLSNTLVLDLSPLRKLPIERINLHNCPNITDFSPLLECTNLLEIILPANEDIGVLRNHPSLQLFTTEPRAKKADYKRRNEFWAWFDQGRMAKDVTTQVVTEVEVSPQNLLYSVFEVTLSDLTQEAVQQILGNNLSSASFADARLGDLALLSGLPLKKLSLTNTDAFDLSPLRGMPIEYLSLGETMVADLSPLAGAPLKWLSLFKTRVSDLSPLAGLPLEQLNLSISPVTSLLPLAHSPIKRLNLNDARYIEDLDPLMLCTNLEELILPPNADPSVLRNHPTLRRLSYEVTGGSYWFPAHAVKEFWAGYDAGELVLPKRSLPASEEPAPAPMEPELPQEIPDGAISATSRVELVAAEGRNLMVVGKVGAVSKLGKTGMIRMSFDGVGADGFYGVIYPEQAPSFSEKFGASLARSLIGRIVLLEGPLSLYKRTPQIILRSPDQLTILNPAGAKGESRVPSSY